MSGFFSSDQLKSTSRVKGRVYSCVTCGRLRTCRTPRMPVYGKGEKRILIVKSGPSYLEDRLMKYWAPSEDIYFRKALTRQGIDYEKDCWTTGAYSCFFDTTDDKNIIRTCQSCYSRLLADIRRLKPTLILPLGESAIASLIGFRQGSMVSYGGVSRWRGWIIPDQFYKAWVCPIDYRPGELRPPPEFRTMFNHDLRRALDTLAEPFPERGDDKKRVEIIAPEQLYKFLRKISQGNQVFAFDYETTGKKLQRKGHKLLTMSYCDSLDRAYVWEMPTGDKELDALKGLLRGPGRKVAHNMKYEDHATKILLGYNVTNWFWDSMLAAHLLDNRPGVTGLKFQAYVQFGVLGYEEEVAPYMGSNSKDTNEFNRLEKYIENPVNKRRLLQYCGLDSLYEYELMLKQRRELGYDENV